MLRPVRTPRSSVSFDPVSRNRRARVARVCLGLALGLLAAAFFRLQILEHEIHVRHSTQNQVRTIPLPAPRGFLYDRNGEVIAENLPAYSVSLLPPSEAALDRGMRKIGPILGLDGEAIAGLSRQYRLAPGQPILIDDDVDYRTLSLLEEKRSDVQGLLLQPKPRRVYPEGSATAHLTGYVAQISEDELAEREDSGYFAGDIIGKTGLERVYEDRIRGEKGARYLEVDALGRRVGPWAVRSFEPPARGEDQRLTIDLDLQRRAAEIFPRGERGAVVAMDPRTGEILAMYSHPTYDPNVFSGRLTRETWSRLVDDPDQPLLNRAIQARYSPGSVFKLATAAMAMTLGVVDPDAYAEVPCRGGYQFGSRWFGCHSAHGWAQLQDAIVTSCNTYFYQVGLKLGLEELIRFGRAWGFDQKTGVDLPNEVRNIFPASMEWYDDRYGEGKWGSGVVLNLAIGQGEVAVTPLKMAQFVSAVVNGGELLRPHLRMESAEPEVIGRLPLSSDQFEILSASMTGVINDWRGTAFRKASHEPLRYTIGGKSGTTEHRGGKAHAWFVAAGPMENPQIVVAVIVEQGGSGSAQSPIAVDLIQRYLDRQHGVVPSEPVPPPPIALGEGAPIDE